MLEGRSTEKVQTEEKTVKRMHKQKKSTRKEHRGQGTQSKDICN